MYMFTCLRVGKSTNLYDTSVYTRVQREKRDRWALIRFSGKVLLFPAS